MNTKPTYSAARLMQAYALNVLKLKDVWLKDWARIRAVRYATLHKSKLVRIVLQCAGALAMVGVLVGHIRPLPILAWLVLIGMLQWNIYHTDNSFANLNRRRVTRKAVIAQVTSTFATAMVWILPILALGWQNDLETPLKVWTVLAIMMAGSVITMPAVPMRSLLFSFILTAASVVSFIASGFYDIALVIVIFLAVLAFGALTSAKMFLASRMAEAKMIENNEVVSMLLREFEEQDAHWLWQVDVSRRVRSVSIRFANALNRKIDDVEGMPLIQLITGPEWEIGNFAPSVHELTKKLKQRDHFANLLVRVIIDGTPRWWELSGTPRFDANNLFCGFRGVGSDVTKAHESSEKIAWLARYDTLTGLPNRLMLTESLATALEYAHKWRINCAFLMIDLDRFKAVNDTLGHHIGDQLLANVSERLKQQLGENEMCGRLGGDEFAIVMRDASCLDDVKNLAERVIASLSQPYIINNHSLFVGASIGSAIGTRDGGTVDMLVRNADLALYQAKDLGGNTHCMYEPSLHAHAEERRLLESSLRQALEKDEFHVIYQPVVDAETEAIVSFEALLRWNNCDYGSVMPSKFVPIAEDTRLIVPIGEWVLRTVCQEALNWPSHIRLAVNISGEQLLDSNFAASVVTALSSSGLEPHRLEIEVTESIFLRDASQARIALEEIMALGCTVALDDFGTGYSSLGYLRKLHFSTIKIDRSFVQGAATGNAESLAIIRAVVAMADSLGMSTTAEGAETLEQVYVIRQLGCQKIQGYFFGRPMLASDAKALLNASNIPPRKIAGKSRRHFEL